MRKYYCQRLSQSLSRHQSRLLGFRSFNLIESHPPQCTNLHTIRGFCASPQQSNSNPSTPSSRVSDIVNELMNLTLLESADLTEVMRKKMGINEMPVMAVMMPGMGLKTGMKGGAGGSVKGGEEKAAEKTAFDLKLEGGFDAGSKIKIIKEVRTFTDLGLKEAKELVEKAPTLLKKGSLWNEVTLEIMAEFLNLIRILMFFVEVFEIPLPKVDPYRRDLVCSSNKQSTDWRWENATAGSVAGLATVTFSHPLDVVRTRFQVNDGRNPNLPTYKHTPHALFTIGRSEGLRGLYSGFCPAVLGSTISWGLYFFFYNRAKQRYLKNQQETTVHIHLASAAEAGGLVCLFTNPIWLVKTRLQLQTPQNTRAYTGFADALKTILKDEGWRALYKGLLPGLFLVTHGAIQFTAYEELRKLLVDRRDRQMASITTAADLLASFRKKLRDLRDKQRGLSSYTPESLTTVDYAVLGASSKLAASLATYPFQVIRSRLQQRPMDGVPRYMDSWHAVKQTARLEGVRGFYRGITANLLKNLPAASITFIVYENVLHLLKLAKTTSERANN
ncbi:unnamed protein product [Lactuca saligna]|uniref:Large ribosomal subunit protein bL12 C-terminal domain-containing protein n=1 Tax=Lactuca saligna TaxID=75948 RepID=A0AA35VNY0_LACSI|nr:unnamed protein product [Lactuca saligna]